MILSKDKAIYENHAFAYAYEILLSQFKCQIT